MIEGLGSLLWDSDVFAAPGADALPLPLPVAPPPSPAAAHVPLPPRADLWHAYGLADDDDADGGGGGGAAAFGVPAVVWTRPLAPGVITLDDDDDDDDVIVVITRDPPGVVASLAPDMAASYIASPLAFWIGKIGYAMETAVLDVSHMGGQVVWQLPPTLGQDIVMWAVAHINGALAQGGVHSFYIGLTSLVYFRWWGRKDADIRSGPLLNDKVMVGHCFKGWHRMTLLAVSDDAGVIARAEKAVIGQYRQRGPSGEYLGPPSRGLGYSLLPQVGDSRCGNRRPGGEGGEWGGKDSPHILYVCMRWEAPHGVDHPFRLRRGPY
jgi:hypothetical protein